MSYQGPYPLAQASTVKEELVAIKIELQSVMNCMIWLCGSRQ